MPTKKDKLTTNRTQNTTQTEVIIGPVDVQAGPAPNVSYCSCQFKSGTEANLVVTFVKKALRL